MNTRVIPGTSCLKYLLFILSVPLLVELVWRIAYRIKEKSRASVTGPSNCTLASEIEVNNYGGRYLMAFPAFLVQPGGG
jgi:hypothetical protein